MRTRILGVTAAAATLLFATPELGGAAAAAAGGVPQLGHDSSLVEQVRGGGGFRGGGGGFRGGGMAFRGGGFRGGGMAFRGGGFRGVRGPGFAAVRGPRGTAAVRTFRGGRVAGVRTFRGTRVAGFRGHRVFRNGRWIWIGAPLVYGATYWGGGGCGWLYSRAVATGSSYWWSRYYDCAGY